MIKDVTYRVVPGIGYHGMKIWNLEEKIEYLGGLFHRWNQVATFDRQYEADDMLKHLLTPGVYKEGKVVT